MARPTLPAAFQNRLNQAVQARRSGDMAGAGRILADLHRVVPHDPIVAFELSTIRWYEDRLEDAATLLRQSLRVLPDFAQAACNLAMVLWMMGRHREGLRHGQQALRLEPRNPKFLHTVSLLLTELNEPEQALVYSQESVSLDPSFVESRYHLVGLLLTLRRYQESAEEAKRVLAIEPEHGGALGVFVGILSAHCYWKGMEDLVPRLESIVRRGDFQVTGDLAQISDDPTVFSSAARRSPSKGPVRWNPGPKQIPGPITLAYLSPDLGNHAVGHMMMEVLPAHDRTRFRVLLARIARADGSVTAVELDRRADGVLDLSEMDDDQAATELRRAGVQVLVDLAGLTNRHRSSILQRRPAPVQILWLGYPLSTGNSWYDAMLLDEVVAPPGVDDRFSEPLLRLPVCYHPISTGGTRLDETMGRREFGLLEEAVVLAALHQPKKITPAQFSCWCRIVAVNPLAVLWMSISDSGTRDRLRQVAVGHGLAPGRLVFCEPDPDRSRYLARYRLADLVLDAFPYGGHSTVGEALAVGCPVISRAGANLHSRVGASMLRQVGLERLVADSFEAYEAKAIEVVTDPHLRSALHDQCRRIADSLTVDRSRNLVSHLEHAYLQLLHP